MRYVYVLYVSFITFFIVIAYNSIVSGFHFHVFTFSTKNKLIKIVWQYIKNPTENPIILLEFQYKYYRVANNTKNNIYFKILEN